jgi:predicted permease
MWWHDLRLRLRALATRRRTDLELEDELQFHLLMEARKHETAGLSGPEAARLARLRFGPVDAVVEECRSVRGIDWFETAVQDTRYALRSFRRSPGFVLAVVATIALGLAPTTALFTIFNHYALRPFAVADPYRLYGVAWTDRTGHMHDLSWNAFEALRSHADIFSDVAATRFLATRANGHVLQGQLVTGNYFQMLGIGPALGRTLLPADTVVPGGPALIVLSYATWQDAFGSDPQIVGKRIWMQGRGFDVIGVAQKGFRDIGDVPMQFWAPIFTPTSQSTVRTIGRLARGVSLPQASAAVTLWAQQMTSDRPDPEKAAAAELLPKATAVHLTTEMLLVFSPIVIAFVLILCLACANVANLMLARSIARQREIGIRLSLGAPRHRLVRQLLTECLLLSLFAAVVAFALSNVLIEGAIRVMFATVPHDLLDYVHPEPLRVDGRVFAFVMLSAVISAILFGLVPALQATRSVAPASRGAMTRDHAPGGLRNALIVGQVGACLLLLTCSGVLLRSARAMSILNLGFTTENVVVIRVAEALRAPVLDRLRREPMISSIAAATSPPMNGVLPEIGATSDRGDHVGSWYDRVSPAFFSVLDVAIVDGRNFSEDEARFAAPVVIVSEAAARRFWPRERAVGRLLRTDAAGPTKQSQDVAGVTVRVIGVARDILSCCVVLGMESPVIYFPASPDAKETQLLLKVRGDLNGAQRRVEGSVDAVGPGALEEIHPMEQYVGAGIYPFRAASWIAAALGSLAMILTMTGILGVLSYLVTQRTREIGIRVALGATARAVAVLVAGESVRFAAMGAGVGIALSLAVSRLAASALPFLEPFDLATCAGALLLVLAATLCATVIPARRAARIDPSRTLRVE